MAHCGVKPLTKFKLIDAVARSVKEGTGDLLEGGLDILRANHELSSKYNRIDNQIKVLCFVCVRPLFIWGVV